ncbi:MAG TPA: OadG family protein [Bacteroidales bacterium]|nr:OadG family protein [Bacteroidales bacterium]
MMIINEISLDFSNVDVQAWTIFIAGWVIVFLALIILSTIFRAMPSVMNIGKKTRERKIRKEEAKRRLEAGEEPAKDGEVTGELTAAIGYALHLYFNELHDDEDRILTVVHKSRKYSPWNSKIYNVMDFKR